MPHKQRLNITPPLFFDPQVKLDEDQGVAALTEMYEQFMATEPKDWKEKRVIQIGFDKVVFQLPAKA